MDCQGCERNDCPDCHKRKCPNCGYIDPHGWTGNYLECSECGLPHSPGMHGEFIIQDGSYESKVKTLQTWIKKNETKLSKAKKTIASCKETIKAQSEFNIPRIEQNLKNLHWQLDALKKKGCKKDEP